MHFFDPHANYSPPEPFDKTYKERPYDGEIAYVDSVIGQFLDILKSRGMMSNTLIVLTSDHGESLGQHGERTHGLFLYESTVRVPLIMHQPGKLPEGKEIDSQVSLIDLAPTILDFAGVSADSQISGKSIKPLIQDKKSKIRETGVYIESFMPKYTYNWKPVRGLRTNRWKYIQSDRKELYNLKKDFWETNNLFNENKDTALKMREEFSKLKNSLPEDRKSTRKMKKGDRKKLKSLGYLGGSRKDSAEQLSKGKMLGIMNMMVRANNLIASGNTEEGKKVLKKVIKADPQNTDAERILGEVLLDNNRYREARGHIKKAIALSAIFDPNLYLNLAQCYQALGKPKKAEREINRVFSSSADYSKAHRVAGRIYYDQRKTKKAIKHFEKALEMDERLDESRIRLGKLYLAEAQYDKAIKQFGVIIEKYGADRSKPNQLTAAYLGTGLALKELDKISDSIYFFEQTLSLNPGHSKALIQLGNILIKKDKTDKLKKHLQNYLDTKPDKDSKEYRKIQQLLTQLEKESQKPGFP